MEAWYPIDRYCGIVGLWFSDFISIFFFVFFGCGAYNFRTPSTVLRESFLLHFQPAPFHSTAHRWHEDKTHEIYICFSVESIHHTIRQSSAEAGYDFWSSDKEAYRCMCFRLYHRLFFSYVQLRREQNPDTPHSHDIFPSALPSL